MNVMIQFQSAFFIHILTKYRKFAKKTLETDFKCQTHDKDFFFLNVKMMTNNVLLVSDLR